jgi:hypothetical protein
MEYLICTASAKPGMSEHARYQAMLRYDTLMARHELTGLLVLLERSAVCYLEGCPDDLTRVCLALCRDSALSSLAIDREGTLRRRRSTRWHMAYATELPPHHPAFSAILCDPEAALPGELDDVPELAALLGERSGRLIARAVGG